MKITVLVIADVAVIFAESQEVLVMALEALHEEAKPLGLEVSWLQTNVQVFGGLLDETVQSVHACSEDIEILDILHTLVAQVHNDGLDEHRTHSYRGHQLYPPLQQDGVESWCSEKQMNKLLEQAMFPALSHAAWVDVFVTTIRSYPALQLWKDLLPGSDIIRRRERV
ncbi:hypothetical protein GWK47_000205 [Chionoecetes opilio]|uniref:Uncharacterized protein n=1 Tax=Chionoecetes opilio TaxID=41210 RepID=A0A8J4XLU5_CHIOP|nr:hypothetical protein GWK47_000205 [Chionoecetes opilio]